MFYVLVRRQPSAQPLSTAATDLKTLQKHRNKFRSLILIVRGLNSVFQFFFFKLSFKYKNKFAGFVQSGLNLCGVDREAPLEHNLSPLSSLPHY
jgi:hypothetical protein